MDIKELLSEEIIVIFNYAKLTYKDEMRDIVEQIDQLIESIEYDSQKLDEIRGTNEQISSLKQMYSRIDCLQTLSNYLLPDSEEESFDNENNDFDKENIKEKINYNDKIFAVDVNIPHTLYENFTYTRPAYLEIESHRIEASQWKELFIKLCEYLIEKNEKLFRSFLHDPTMKGKKYVYFSEDYTNFRDARKISNSNIYVESNFSAQTIRNIIIKMLEKYRIPKHKCLIYLRKDYSALHYTSKNAKTINEIDINNPNIKIGKYAKDYFFKLFQQPISIEQLHNFLDKEWCHDNLGICYPLLKKVDLNKPLSKQRGYNNQYGRYYATEFVVNNEKYLLCSQWFESNRPKLNSWIEKQNQSSVFFNEYVKNIHEINFGKKYNSFHIYDNVLIEILKVMQNMWVSNNDIVMGNITKTLSMFIRKNTSYNKPDYVISKIKDYLLDNNVIKVRESYKKNHYLICDENKLEQIIANPTIIEIGKQEIKNSIAKTKVYIIKKHQRKCCPICDGALYPLDIKYNIYEDVDCTIIVKQQKTYGKTCPNCHNIFMTEGTYTTLLNQIISFNDKTNLCFEHQFIENE